MARLRLALRLLWLFAVFWAEHLVFRRSLADCIWPGASSTPGWTHVMLVADPQILDLQSYPDRAWVLQYLSQWMTDLNMRRSWAAAKRLRPDAAVFLGDMMDRGRANMSTHEYEMYYSRFKRMFRARGLPTYFLPGNHDVGLGDTNVFSPHAQQRFTTHFGPLAQTLELGGHTLVFIDAPTLVNEDAARTYARMPVSGWSWPAGGAFDFVRTTAANLDKWKPVVLLTHVPLARPVDADCGPLRERGTIRAGRGLGYENTLGSEVSASVLNMLLPAIVFSGDDHDYCDYTHTGLIGDTIVREVTVRSFSMAMGVRRPGFQLLSLSPSPPSSRTTPCLLPDQIAVYLRIYVPLLLFSLALLAGDTFRRSGQRCEDCMDGLDLDPPRGRLPGPAAHKWSRDAGKRRKALLRAYGREVTAVAGPPALLWAAMAVWSFL